MFIRICFCFLCMGLVGRAQQTISLCGDATANTSLGCVGELDGLDHCPNRPDNPCCTQTVCEYNANAQTVMPWNAQTYTWQLRGHANGANSATAAVNRYKLLQAGQPGRQTQLTASGPGGASQPSKKLCERRYLCECEEDEYGSFSCVSVDCGVLELLNIVRGYVSCVAEGNGPGGGAGGGAGGTE
jgi:hypothetical protein